MATSNDWADDGFDYRLPPEEFLVALGEITVLFALLESTIEALVTGLAEIRGAAGLVVTVNLNAKAKIELAHCLVQDRYREPKRKAAETWRTHLGNIREQPGRL